MASLGPAPAETTPPGQPVGDPATGRRGLEPVEARQLELPLPPLVPKRDPLAEVFD